MVQVATTYLQRLVSRIRSRSAAALLIVLALGIGEPALCILHCTVWIPLVAHASHTTGMQAGTMQHGLHVAPGSLASWKHMYGIDGMAALQIAPGTLQCRLDVAPDAPPHAPSAQPFHEFSLPAAILLNLAVLVVLFRLPVFLAPLLPRPAPPLRPPIF